MERGIVGPGVAILAAAGCSGGTMTIPGGFIFVARSLTESEVWEMPHWCLKAWIWLLLRANHADKGGGRKLQRGQLWTTLKMLQEATTYWAGNRPIRPSISQLAKFLRRLSESHAIDTTKATRGVVITICNYDTYQTAANYESHGEISAKSPRKRKLGHTIDKNGRILRTEETTSFPAFGRFWDAWPKHRRKSGRARCLGVWQSKNLEAKSAQVLAVLDACKRMPDWLKESGQYIPAPLTWLNQDRWDCDLADLAQSAGDSASGQAVALDQL